jgi:hypothetical protein
MDTRARDDGSGPEEMRGRRGLERLRGITQLFDQAFRVPGTQWRFGLDAMFGLIPGLGDVAGAIVAIYALRVARQLRAPGVVQMHMLSNIAIDALVGTVPLLGDLFDFVYKAQTRNLKLLDDWIGTPHATVKRSKRGLLLIPIAILVVFATLTVLGVWMMVIFFSWLAGVLSGG